MRAHVLWGVVWALPAVVAMLAVPFYVRSARMRHVTVMRAIAIPSAVVAVFTVLYVATLIIVAIRIGP